MSDPGACVIVTPSFTTYVDGDGELFLAWRPNSAASSSRASSSPAPLRARARLGDHACRSDRETRRVSDAVTAAGVTFDELASRLGLTVAEARGLFAPFLVAGIVAERDVAFAIAGKAPEP
jgi:hypothetical protein